MSVKVSIIVPVYNAEKHLEECVQSILAQELTDWELFLVNDGSKDGSLALCRKYEAQDARIHVLDGPNGGVSAARNRGLDAAQGKYIGFVDADDFIAPQMYKRLTEEIEEKETDLMFCTHADWQDGKTTIPERLGAKESRVGPGTEVLREVIQTRGINCWRVLYRRELLQKYRIQFSQKMRYAEDSAFVCTCLRYAQRVGFCPDVLYYYRREGQNTTEHYMPQLEQDMRQYTEYLMELANRTAQETLRVDVLRFRAMTALYAIFNVCKERTPLSFRERLCYAKELSRKPYYQEALGSALQQKKKDGALLTAEIWLVKQHLVLLPVLYYSVLKPVLNGIQGHSEGKKKTDNGKA